MVTPGVPHPPEHRCRDCVRSTGARHRSLHTPEVVKTNLGFNAWTQEQRLKLTAWLGRRRITTTPSSTCVDDYGQLTSWTQQCIKTLTCSWCSKTKREPGSHRVSGGESGGRLHHRVTKELVLRHTENTRIPTATARWLEVRPWISLVFIITSRSGQDVTGRSTGGSVSTHEAEGGEYQA